MEELIKEKGFDSLEEFNQLVANIDLTSIEKMTSFEYWKNNDGSKEGILKLASI